MNRHREEDLFVTMSLGTKIGETKFKHLNSKKNRTQKWNGAQK